MNIWQLNKSEQLKAMLLSLESELIQHTLDIDSTAQCDESGVYLHHRENKAMRAYIFVTGQQKNKFGVHLEFPQHGNYLIPMEIYEGINYQRLKHILSPHLDLLFSAD